MLSAKEYFGELITEKTQDPNLIKRFVGLAIEQVHGHQDGIHNGLVSVLEEREDQILTSPQIESLKDGFCHETTLLLSQGLEGNDEAQCLRGLQAISNVLFIIFVNQIIIDNADKLDYLQIRAREGRDSAFVTRIKVGRRTRSSSTSFGKKRSKADALSIAIKEREKLISEREEQDKRSESKKPNLTIARSLAERGILKEYEPRKFKVAGISIEETPHESSSKMLRIRHENIPGGSTSRSLDKHSFPDAYEDLINLISRLYDLNPQEIQELKKYCNRFLYIQKTSSK